MSPTSYQAAPPRDMRIFERRDLRPLSPKIVKELFWWSLNAKRISEDILKDKNSRRHNRCIPIIFYNRWLRYITSTDNFPANLEYFFFSSQLSSISKSIPSVDASIAAAISSAWSPASFSVLPKAWCSLIYPYAFLSTGTAKPTDEARSRLGAHYCNSSSSHRMLWGRSATLSTLCLGYYFAIWRKDAGYLHKITLLYSGITQW